MTTEQKFSALFDGYIWRIVADEYAPILVLEIRNYDNREVSYAAVDIEKFQLLWHDFRLSELWWAGIEAVANGLIYFHGYNHIQYANHIGINCLDVAKKEILWENKHLIFHSLNRQHLIAQNRVDAYSSSYQHVNPLSGEVLYTCEILPIDVEVPRLHQAISTRFYPMFMEETDYNFTKIVLFVKKILKVDAVLAIEYLEHNAKIVISFHTKQNNKLQNRLILLDSEANILHDWILGDDLVGIARQTFLVIGTHIIFVQHKNEIKIYEL